MKRTLLFTAIASILTLNAYATSSTVTSKGYVDARDALKQDLIPSKNVTITIDGNEVDVPSIVLYPADGENAGTIGETGFVSVDVTYAKQDELERYDDDADSEFIDYKEWLNREASGGGVAEYAVSGATLAYAMDLVNRKKTDPMVCAGWPDGATQYDATHTDENCWLWNKD